MRADKYGFPECQRSILQLVEIQSVSVRGHCVLSDYVPAASTAVGDGQDLAPGDPGAGREHELDGVTADRSGRDRIIDAIRGIQREGAALGPPSLRRFKPVERPEDSV